MDELRHGYSRVLGCTIEDVALTTSTSEGLGAVLAGIDLGPGDEIISSDQEHPGMLGPLKAARDRGVEVRLVPFPELANAVRGDDDAGGVLARRLGERRARARRAGRGRRPRDPRRRPGRRGGAARHGTRSAARAYAAAGQKWLCGADGTGMLYVSQEFRAARAGDRAELHLLRGRLEGPGVAAQGRLPGATTPRRCRARCSRSARARCRCSSPTGSTPSTRAPPGSPPISPSGSRPRAARSGPAREHHAGGVGGRRPRGRARPPGRGGRARRNLPGTRYLRASVGAWNDESDLERLLAAL